MKRGSVVLVAGLLLGCSLWLDLARNHLTNRSPPKTHSDPARSVTTHPALSAGLAVTGRPLLPQSGISTPKAGPAPRKRPWDRAFLGQFIQATSGNKIGFELAAGEMASGTLAYLVRTNGEVMYLSGTLTQPEAGRFFFQKQTRPGVAGDFVGVVEFPASRRAYRIEPSGPGGAPELVERQLGEVLCEKLPRPSGSVTNQSERIPPFNPANFPQSPILANQKGITSLESLRGATAVVYLDFQGGSTPSWGGITYAAPAVDNDQIREVWSRVAEDFMPFNIDVTTDLRVFQNAPQGSRQHVIITPTATAAPDAGGVAYVGSFNFTGDTPCWVFESSGKACAEACSHEIGHTLGLVRHETQDINGTHIEYYEGQGVDAQTAWAPIMGVGYYRNVSQWAHGEYLDAGNLEDELAEIATHNNDVACRPDDTGDTLATSRYLEMYADYTASAEGVIERTADTDAFQFTTSGGEVSLRADPASIGPDLALAVSLYDANDALVASNCPQDTLWAALDTNLAAGTYTFRVTGTGRNDPLTNGFSSYASLGFYSITGFLANARLPDRFQIPEHTVNGTIVGIVSPRVPNGDPLGFAILAGNTGNTFAIDSSGALTVADNTLLDYGTLASQSEFAVQFELFVDITDLQNGFLSETNRRVVVAITAVPPMITVEPSVVAALASSTVSLSASATSPRPSELQVQWFFNGLPLQDAYASTLILTNVQSWNSGEYFAVAMDAFSSATSQVAVVTVDPARPVIVFQPQAQAAFPGLGATFGCFAGGSEPFSYQWQFNGVDLPGATQAQLTLSNISPQQAGIYRAVVTNSMGTAISAGAALEIVPVAAWGWDSAGQTDLHTSLTNVVQVAAGAVHNLALRRDGSVFAWGAANQCNVPAGLSNVVAIAAAADHSLALTSDGTVTAWGDDSAGQLDLPAAATSIVAIAAGPKCTLALKSNGQVLACGEGTSNPNGRPPILTNIVAIAAGSNHCLAVRADGGVIAWGDDSFGQSDVPTNLNNVVAIAAGATHSLALKSDGTVVGWGNNANGQVTVPTLLSNVVEISAGGFNSFALKADGTLLGWGAGGSDSAVLFPNCGQSSVPASVTNVTQVSCGLAHTLALVGDGPPFVVSPPVNQFASAGSQVVFRVSAAGAFPLSYQWQFMGTNLAGATNQLLLLDNVSNANAGLYSMLVSNSLGVVSSVTGQLTVATSPFVIAQPQDQSICVGGSGSMQVAAGGLPPFSYQWSFNGTPVPGATNSVLTFNDVGFGQAGQYYVSVSNAVASITSQPANLNVSQVAAWGVSDGFAASLDNYGQINVPNGLTGVVQVAAGGFHSLALKSDGTVVAWGAGSGSVQQEKSQDYGQCSVPVGLSNVVAIAAGRYHSLALTQRGQVIAWGAGNSNLNRWPDYGQSIVPQGLGGVIAIAAGDYHSVALKQTGFVVVWGGSTPANLTNVPVYGYVVSIASAATNILALTAFGQIWQWGTGEPIPSYVNDPVALATGANFSLALRGDGTVFGWGRILPPQGLTNVIEVAAGAYHALAVKKDGIVVTWGQTNGSPAAAVPVGLAKVIDVASGQYHSLAAVGNASVSIRTQPTDQTVLSGAQTFFAVGAIGPQPLKYQWRFNGNNLPGRTQAWLRLLPVQTANAGDYQVVVTSDFGAVTSRVAKLSVRLSVDFALGNTSTGSWIIGGEAGWFTQTNVTHGTTYAVQSGAITEGQQSSLQTTVTGPGSLSFWWKVSSQQGFDFLNVYMDNVKLTGISGAVDWQQKTLAIPGGSHSVAWVYEKYGGVPSGLDCGWLDQVVYTLAPPVITSQPVSQVVNAGQTVLLNVAATGPPPLKYQWSKDGIKLLHQVYSQLWISSATRQDAGAYQVLVSNPAGASILSSAARVQVIAPQRIIKAGWQPDGTFELVSIDSMGVPLMPSEQWAFQAEVSTNLVDWTTLQTPTELWYGSLIVFDPDASNSLARFYRIVEHRLP